MTEYEKALAKIADDISQAHREDPAEKVATLIEEKMNALTVAGRSAILKVAGEVDFVGAQEFADLTSDEALAWKLMVMKVRES